MVRTLQIISATIILSLLALNFSQFPVAATSAGVAQERDDVKGLRFRLSEGAEQSKAERKSESARATRLSDAEIESILKRMPLAADQTDDEQEFVIREPSLPPPRAGEVKQVEFPPAVNTPTPDLPESGPLTVLRYAPEGNVSFAPQLSVTFSQPMVALDSHEEMSEHVPVKLSPQPPGKWRWVGTRTLLFEPQGRFPMATQYSVTVPAGVRSANGDVLAAEKSWKFLTPVPTIKSTYPANDDPQPRDVLMFVGFDQRIDAAALLKKITVRSGVREIQTRPATAEEIAANDQVRQLAQTFADRYVAFRAVDSSTGQTAMALPQAARITVTIDVGTPSAEGPRVSAKTQKYSFRTHGFLGVKKYVCNDGRRCQPGDRWEIEFNNPIDEDSFDESRLKIEPAINNLDTSLYGETLVIDGDKRARTTYRVTLDPSIKDEFGQALGPRQALTFHVGSAPRNLFVSEKDFVVLDPFGPPTFHVYSVNYSNLRVQLHSVGPEDYPKWIAYQKEIDADRPRRNRLPGQLVFTKIIGLTSKPDKITETEIDLTPALRDGQGQMILSVQAVGPTGKLETNLGCWLQRTNIGLDAIVDKTELVAWATSLKDGMPLSGVEMKLLASENRVTSSSDGTGRLRLPPTANLPDLLIARHGQDVAILPSTRSSWEDDKPGWLQKPQADYLRWYVFDDRKLYRPGEEVHVKGWIRRVGGSQRGDVGAPGNDVTATDIIYWIKDSLGVEITKAGARLGPHGGFDLRLKLPARMNLGSATLELITNSNLSGSTYSHNFQVQEFRRPEFEVNASTESEGPYFVGSEANVSVTAAYFAGGGLQDTEVTWTVTSEPESFTPPNRQDWTFGKWKPWWMSFSYHSTDTGQHHRQQLTGRTDALGKHLLRINFDSVSPPQPSTVTAQVSVKDVNRQAWTSSTTMLVHPSSLYVGLRSEKIFVQSGEPLVIQSLVTDLDGNAVPGREIKMRAVQLDWKQLNGKWQQVETNPRDCSVESRPDAAICSFPTGQGGQYRVTATIVDDHQRPNESELTLWVAGQQQPVQRELDEKQVELIPDRKEYGPGDTAQILVQTPLYPASGLLTLSRSGILKTEQIVVSGPTHILHVPIEEAWTPNVHLQVSLAGVENGETKRAAYGSSELTLSIPPVERRLQITATPREKTLEPGAETNIAIEVKDHAGKAVAGGEVAVVVVDESVLALTNYKLEDPLGVFYTRRDSETKEFRLREDVLQTPSAAERERFLEEFWRAGGGGPGGAGGGADFMIGHLAGPVPLRVIAGGVFRVVTKSGVTPDNLIHLRQKFDALAAFAPSVQTDFNGRATVKVKLPDSLTRYRVMAVAVAGGKQFGMGESAITARLPLMVRASAPRFLNFGDRFDLPVVVQNQTEKLLTVDVVVSAMNGTFSESHAKQSTDGRRVTVPANDRVEVRFPAAPAKPGDVHFQIAAVSESLTDATHVSLPVLTPATTEVSAVYGQIDGGAVAQPVKAPDHIFPQFGGLEVTASSTQLSELTEAVLYLTSYPYECSEQMASRVLGIVALQDVLGAFKSQAIPSPAELKNVVTLDLKRLEQLQHNNGGYSFWRHDDDDWPYLSIHVAHAFARARARGFAVRNDTWKKSIEYLRRIETHIPKRYSKDSRGALIAYAIYVRALMNDKDPARARKLILETGLEKLSLEAVGWVLNVLSDDKNSKQQVETIRRLLNNRATDTAGAAHFVTAYRDGAEVLLHSRRRADGVILEALIGNDPQNDLIPKIVKGLLAHRRKGRWENTQENVFILLAMDRYFNTYEKVTPDFVARVWLGNAYVGQQEFNGRSADSFNVKLPMPYLLNQRNEQPLTISKEGPGRLYYRTSLSYAPVNLNLNPADHGFAVQRKYEAVDHPDDVRQEADGSWHVKPGARVRILVHMVASERRYHVALVDPMPAGFEALNPALATTGSIPEAERDAHARRWKTVWFNHQNLRDERAEAFTSLLRDGVYTYSYVARATTPGLFVVPPPRVEEMYSPETFGRGKTDHVRID